MNHKIVKTPDTGILVYIDLTEDGNDVVVVQGKGGCGLDKVKSPTVR